MKNTGFYLIILAVILITGCPLDEKINGNGNITSSERITTDFSGVFLEGAGNINIYFSENYKVIVTTDSNIQDIVTIETKNSFLYVDEKRGNGINPTKLIVDVYLPELENITLKGTGNIKIISGKTSDFEIKLSGVGNIEAQNYEAENVVVTLSGTGDIKTWVTKSLTGNISGVGNVLYRGNPSVNNVNRSGVGDVKRL